jgi:pentatricopeptide repeat protein
VKCGFLSRGEEVFYRLSNPNLAAWNSLIHGYSEQDRATEAVLCFDLVQSRSMFPDAFTLACVLRALGRLKAIHKGRSIHTQIGKRHSFQEDFVLLNSLVDMYAKCGLLDTAQKVFDSLPLRNIVSWNTMISEYVEHGQHDEALCCYESLEFEGVSANSVTLMSILKSCSTLGSTEKGREIHAEIEAKGLLKSNLSLGNALIDMYGKCGFLREAQKIFDDLLVRDVVSWTALITGYTEHNCGEEALKYFEQMQFQGIPPNVVTFSCSLKACTCVKDVGKGEEIHNMIKRCPSLKEDLVVCSALLSMYARFGFLEKAQEVLDSLSEKTVALWNTLIIAYTECNHGKEALECHKQMQLEGIIMNTITYVWCLKACIITGDVNTAQEIHSRIDEFRLEDPSIGSTLIDLYAKFGLLTEARSIFDKLPCRDVVMWTTLIGAYTENEHGKEALMCFEKMQQEGVIPNVVTFICILQSCSSTCATDKGEEIHVEIERKGLLEKDLLVGNTLINMYGRCGLPSKAHRVCDKIPIRNTVSWTAVMAGYTQVGDIENVFYVLERMVMENMQPDAITFVVLLNACSHVGHFEGSQIFFRSMSKDYGIIPMCEHHNCVLDLLSRTGQLSKAVTMIQEIPFSCDLVVWHTLLGACRKLGNIDVGQQVFEKALGFV